MITKVLVFVCGADCLYSICIDWWRAYKARKERKERNKIGRFLVLEWIENEIAGISGVGAYTLETDFKRFHTEEEAAAWARNNCLDPWVVVEERRCGPGNREYTDEPPLL